MRINLLHQLLKIQALFSKKMHLEKPQTISFLNFKEPEAPILDIGGGGAGVIGQLFKHNVTAVDIRQNELDESPKGPIKVCADARELPFEDKSFSSTTAFYFLMYLNPSDYKKVIHEVYRTLKPKASFYIWDTCIPTNRNSKKTLFAIPIRVFMPKKTIYTAYGVNWNNHFLDFDLLIKILEEVGFEIKQKKLNDLAIYIECEKKGN